VDLFRIILGALRLINDTIRNPYLSSDLDVKLVKMGRESIFADTMDWTVPGSDLSRLLLVSPLSPPNPALKYSVMIPMSLVPQGKRRPERLRNLSFSPRILTVICGLGDRTSTARATNRKG